MPPWIDWIKTNQTLLAALVIGALAVWWLLPRPGIQRRFGAILAGLAALIVSGTLFLRPHLQDLIQTKNVENAIPIVLFWLFAGTAIVAGVAMITSKNPVYAALWFALVTLSVCGLFLLQSAPFLSAATVVVYAGAIIVTFVFVIMLARQSGESGYDQQSQQPLLATVSAFLLLGAMLSTLMSWREQSDTAKILPSNAPAGGYLGVPESAEANVLSAPVDGGPPGTLRGFGRSLFGDYLFSVELAGTLLMIAAVGAVAIAPRRAQGGL